MQQLLLRTLVLILAWQVLSTNTAPYSYAVILSAKVLQIWMYLEVVWASAHLLLYTISATDEKVILIWHL